MEYGLPFDDIDREVFAPEQCEYVLDVLDMFWNLQDSFNELEDKAGLKESDVTFPGFDGNNEGDFIAYARFWLKEGFDGLRYEPRLNRHYPTTTRYRGMLAQKCRGKSAFDLGVIASVSFVMHSGSK